MDLQETKTVYRPHSKFFQYLGQKTSFKCHFVIISKNLHKLFFNKYEISISNKELRSYLKSNGELFT